MKHIIYLLDTLAVLGVLLIGILMGMAWTYLNNDSLIEGPRPKQSVIHQVEQANK